MGVSSSYKAAGGKESIPTICLLPLTFCLAFKARSMQTEMLNRGHYFKLLLFDDRMNNNEPMGRRNDAASAPVQDKENFGTQKLSGGRCGIRPLSFSLLTGCCVRSFVSKRPPTRFVKKDTNEGCTLRKALDFSTPPRVLWPASKSIWCWLRDRRIIRMSQRNADYRGDVFAFAHVCSAALDCGLKVKARK